jgi:hypothetical protein
MASMTRQPARTGRRKVQICCENFQIRPDPPLPHFLRSSSGTRLNALLETTNARRKAACARSPVAVLRNAFRSTVGTKAKNVLVIARVEEELGFARRVQLYRAVARRVEDEVSFRAGDFHDFPGCQLVAT